MKHRLTEYAVYALVITGAGYIAYHLVKVLLAD
jgi:hypothetical protein